MTEFFTNHISKAPSLSLSGYLALILIFFCLNVSFMLFLSKKVVSFLVLVATVFPNRELVFLVHSGILALI